MQNLIASAAIALAIGSLVGCAGDTSDDGSDDQQGTTQQALAGTYRGGEARPGLVNQATPRRTQNGHQPPITQAQYDDPTQQVEGR